MLRQPAPVAPRPGPPGVLRAAACAAALLAVLSAGVAAPVPAAGADPAPSAGAAVPLDLEQAWRAALANDPTLRAASAAAEAGQELLPQARAALMPQASFSIGRNQNELDTSAPGLSGAPVLNRYRYYSNTSTLSIRQSLLQPAQWVALRQAGAQVAEVDATLAQARQALAARLAEAYVSLLLAQDQIALVASQTQAHERQLDAARKALAAGSGIRTDIDEAQSRLDLDAAQSLEASQLRDLARRQLQQLIGEPFAGIVPLDDQRLREQPPQAGDLADWLARAERNSPEIAAQQARRDTAELEVRKAAARHLPTLDAELQVNRGASDNINRVDSRNTSNSIGLQLNVPLFSGGAIQSAQRQAAAELTRATENLAVVRADLQLRLQREHRGVGEGWLRVLALEQAVRSAEQLVVSSRRSQEAGVRTTLDVLNADQQRATAQRDLAQARYAMLASYVRLHTLAGAFDDQVLSQVKRWFGLAPARGFAAPIVSK